MECFLYTFEISIKTKMSFGFILCEIIAKRSPLFCTSPSAYDWTVIDVVKIFLEVFDISTNFFGGI